MRRLHHVCMAMVWAYTPSAVSLPLEAPGVCTGLFEALEVKDFQAFKQAWELSKRL